MAVDQKRSYGRNSRLRWYEFIYDKNYKTVRFGRKDWSFVRKLQSEATYTLWKIPPEYAHRPDLISNLFFGTCDLWWILSSYNNFFHPINDFYVNRVIRIPNRTKVMTLLI
jgi:hypothetical protein